MIRSQPIYANTWVKDLLHYYLVIKDERNCWFDSIQTVVLHISDISMDGSNFGPHRYKCMRSLSSSDEWLVEWIPNFNFYILHLLMAEFSQCTNFKLLFVIKMNRVCYINT